MTKVFLLLREWKDTRDSVEGLVFGAYITCGRLGSTATSTICKPASLFASRTSLFASRDTDLGANGIRADPPRVEPPERCDMDE